MKIVVNITHAQALGGYHVVRLYKAQAFETIKSLYKKHGNLPMGWRRSKEDDFLIDSFADAAEWRKKINHRNLGAETALYDMDNNRVIEKIDGIGHKI